MELHELLLRGMKNLKYYGAGFILESSTALDYLPLLTFMAFKIEICFRLWYGPN